MIQVGTILNVIDNSGARKASCIKVIGGYRRRYAKIGDLVIVSIKSLRIKRKLTSKVKKGEIYKALIVRIKPRIKNFSGESICFFENSIVLLNKQNKLIGTRIFGSLPLQLRYTKHLRVVSISAGLIY